MREERRGRRGVRDIGVRTRGSDRPRDSATPHSNQVWETTFNLRWRDHMQKSPQKPHAA